MKKILIISICSLLFFQCRSQSQRKVTTYLMAQYNNTLYDYTLGNNPWSVGIGVLAFSNNKTSFKPAIEITRDIYLQDDKVFRSDPNI